MKKVSSTQPLACLSEMMDSLNVHSLSCLIALTFRRKGLYNHQPDKDITIWIHRRCQHSKHWWHNSRADRGVSGESHHFWCS